MEAILQISTSWRHGKTRIVGHLLWSVEGLKQRLEFKSRVLVEVGTSDGSLAGLGCAAVLGLGPGSGLLRPGPGRGTVPRPGQERDAALQTDASTETGAPGDTTDPAPALRLTATPSPAMTGVLGRLSTLDTGMTADPTVTTKLRESEDNEIWK